MTALDLAATLALADDVPQPADRQRSSTLAWCKTVTIGSAKCDHARCASIPPCMHGEHYDAGVG